MDATASWETPGKDGRETSYPGQERTRGHHTPDGSRSSNERGNPFPGCEDPDPGAQGRYQGNPISPAKGPLEQENFKGNLGQPGSLEIFFW